MWEVSFGVAKWGGVAGFAVMKADGREGGVGLSLLIC